MRRRTFFENPRCISRNACKSCRSDPLYRKKIHRMFDVGSVDFECPHGLAKSDTLEEYDTAVKEITDHGSTYMKQFLFKREQKTHRSLVLG